MNKLLRTFVLPFFLIMISAGYALAGDVIVDGEEKYFDSNDIIDNLTVINGGVANLHGAMIMGNLTVINGDALDDSDGGGSTIMGNLMIEGENSYANSFGFWIGGNAIVKDGGRLSIWYSTIIGNLQGDEHGHINFLVSDVGGSIQMTGGGAFNGSIGFCSVGGDIKYEKGSGIHLAYFAVGGNVQVSDNNYGNSYILIKNSEIDGDLQVFNNDVGNNPNNYISILDNTVSGNLEIKGNTPVPIVVGNDVEGSVEVE